MSATVPLDYAVNVAEWAWCGTDTIHLSSGEASNSHL